MDNPLTLESNTTVDTPFFVFLFTFLSSGLKVTLRLCALTSTARKRSSPITIIGPKGKIDLENGNDVSKSLFRLYNRMAMKLIKANVQRNAPLIDEVLDDFVNIRWGFQKAIEIKSGISSVEEVMKQQAINRQNGSLPPAPPYEQALELQMEAALGQLPADNTLTEENSKQEPQVEEQKLQEVNTQIAQPEIGKSEDLSKNLQNNFVSDSGQHVTTFDVPTGVYEVNINKT